MGRSLLKQTRFPAVSIADGPKEGSVDEREIRVRKRLPCDLAIASRRHSGIVLNISPGGLFVQTGADARFGTPIEIALNVPPWRTPIGVEAVVRWRRVVPLQLRSLARGGLGLQIQHAPANYYEYLQKIGTRGERPAITPLATDAAAPDPPASSAGTTIQYRARVRQKAGSRTRILLVESASADDASARAEILAGEGWNVLEIKPA